MAICCCMGCMAIDDNDDNVEEKLKHVLEDVVLNILQSFMLLLEGILHACARNA